MSKRKVPPVREEAERRQEFGERLKELRKGRYTLQQVADYLTAVGHPYTYQAVALWEKGDSAPPAIVVDRLESLFGLEGDLNSILGRRLGPALDDRLRSIEDRQEQQEATLRQLSAQLHDLLAHLQELPTVGVRPQRARR